MSGDFHTHRLCHAFYEAFGELVDGFVGQYELCIAMAQALTDWELLGRQIEKYEREILQLARQRSVAALAPYRAGQGDMRLALDAIQDEAESQIERASLTTERGRVWA